MMKPAAFSDLLTAVRGRPVTACCVILLWTIVCSASPLVARQYRPRAPQRVAPQIDEFVYFRSASEPKPFPRLPGEFESQKALMMTVSDWQPHHSKIFNQIVEKTRGHVRLLVLYNDPSQLRMTLGWLRDASLDGDHVYFSEVPLNTVWIRDFAPIFAETNQKAAQALDFYYEGSRPRDDRLPRHWCHTTSCQFVEVPWTLQGGNLLCNGRHLAVTTSRIFKDNYIRFVSPHTSTNPEFERRKIVTDELLKFCNLKELVVLEPLQSEATSHADMFATFLAADQVVVASVDPRQDPVNSQILDRNARRLEKLKVDDQPMKVHRIRIPPRQGKSWSAYTNVIIANDLVLMPVFDDDPPSLVRQARRVYEQLLPGHTIATVDMTSMKALQGELHCLSVNIPDFVTTPANTMSFEAAVESLK